MFGATTPPAFGAPAAGAPAAGGFAFGAAPAGGGFGFGAAPASPAGLYLHWSPNHAVSCSFRAARYPLPCRVGVDEGVSAA
jgi:hypothetical protein